MPTTYVRRKRKRETIPRTLRVRVAQWIDPFPWAQGSSIEKMVMAEFYRRGIYFQHSTTGNSLPWISVARSMFGQDPALLKADFLLPQYHIWLEIQGAYFHTLPGSPEHDALRFALVQASGWKPIFWWEDDIRTRLQELMNAVPEFYRVDPRLQKGWKTTNGMPFYEGAAPDTLAGLRKALAARAKPPQRVKVKRRSKRKVKYGS